MPAASVHAQHPPALLHHFDTAAQQKDASTLGMWVFLVTEIMFFGGLFTAYIVYRSLHPEGFVEASHELNLTMGAINTAVLICSSLTMVLAVRAAQLSERKSLVLCLILTMILGAVFLGIKAVEYHEKYVNHHVPGPAFSLRRDPMRLMPQMFFFLYFAMTGLHALHMIIGLVLLAILAVRASRGTIHARILHAHRHDRSLLALRRYRLDLPVPAAVSAGRPSARSRDCHDGAYLIQETLLRDLRRAACPHLSDGRGVAKIDLGRFNTHRRADHRGRPRPCWSCYSSCTSATARDLTKLVVVGGFMWLALLIGLTMADVVTRGWIRRLTVN